MNNNWQSRFGDLSLQIADQYLRMTGEKRARKTKLDLDQTTEKGSIPIKAVMLFWRFSWV